MEMHIDPNEWKLSFTIMCNWEQNNTGLAVVNQNHKSVKGWIQIHTQ